MIKTDCQAQKNEECQQPAFSNEVYNSLTTLFPTVLNSALHIVDHGKVTQYVCKESRRSFFRVQESSSQSSSDEHSARPQSERTASGHVYFDIVGDFCCCFFYVKQCLSPQGTAFLCKHVLAAKLAEAISHGFDEKLHVKEIEDIHFSELLLSSRSHMKTYSESKLTT